MAQSILNRVKNKVKEKVEEKYLKDKNDEVKPSQDDTIVRIENDSLKQGDTGNKDLGVYRRFDFVRGAKTILQDAFEEDVIGEYPKRWNSDAGGEVVKLKNIGGNWLKGAEVANHFIDYLGTLPLNFTFEFDVISDAKTSGDYHEFSLILGSTKRSRNFGNMIKGYDNSIFKIDFDFFHGSLTYENRWGYGIDSINSSFLEIISPTQFDLAPFNYKSNPIHISLLRQDQRLVIFVNTTRIADIRNAFAKNTEINNIMYKTFSKVDDQSSGLYFSNLLLAETGLDTRKDMFINGKFVTNAILFEHNSDKITPTSLPAINIIAQYLKNNPAVSIKIIGYTDNIGDEATNLSLSERRAKSVLKELAVFHGIDAFRLSAEGRGEEMPIADNATSEGRAQNRRVEFIKI